MLSGTAALFAAGMWTLVMLEIYLEPVTAAQNGTTDQAWEAFKSKYNRTYANAAEHDRRRQIWEQKMRDIAEHNKNYASGKESYTMGENNFSDLTHNEFMERYVKPMSVSPSVLLPNSRPNQLLKSAQPANPVYNLKAVANPLYYHTNGKLAPIKNMASCQAPWAFATTGMLEYLYGQAAGGVTSMSEQNLLDCNSANSGCTSGTISNALQFIQAQQGIAPTSSYPYQGAVGSCNSSYAKLNFSLTGYGNLNVNQNETALQILVGTLGPVTALIDASRPSFQSYQGGTYNDAGCSTTNGTYAILIAGYNAPSLWLLRNSMGPVWGTSGYMWLKFGSNTCGVANENYYATLSLTLNANSAATATTAAAAAAAAAATTQTTGQSNAGSTSMRALSRAFAAPISLVVMVMCVGQIYK